MSSASKALLLASVLLAIPCVPLWGAQAETRSLGPPEEQGPPAPRRPAAPTGTGTARFRLQSAGDVLAVAFSPDGKVLASAGKDGTICLRDIASGTGLRRFEGHEKAIEVLSFSPDGTLLAAGGREDRVHLWDVDSGKELRAFKLDKGGVGVLAFSPDGKTLASAPGEYLGDTVRLWDVATGKELHRLKDHANRPWSLSGGIAVAFSPDGKTLATVGGDGKVGLWDVVSGKELRSLGRHGGETHSITFSPDGKLLAGGFGGMALLWEVGTGRKLLRLAGPLTWSSAGYLAFSPDGRMLALGGDEAIHLLEVATGQERQRFAGHQGPVLCLRFSADGHQLLCASTDGMLRVHEVLAESAEGVQAVDLDPRALEDLWPDLAAADAARAYRAIRTLMTVPRQSVALLRARLQPVSPPDPQRLVRLIADLDSGRFAVRQKATNGLKQYGELAEPALREVLSRQPSLEIQRRVEQMLASFPVAASSPEVLQVLRALEVLEHLDTPAAEELLKALAQGAAGARQTREAQAALDRRARRLTPAD